jgi:hypothetical protein
MAAIPSTHYVKSDDVYIAYQIVGEGLLDGLCVKRRDHLAIAGSRSRFFRRLASFCRVILFDKRGTGMSDRGSQIFTLEQRMHDVQAVLNEVGPSAQPCSAFLKAGPCPCCTPPPIPNEPLHLFCTAATPSVPGHPIIRSAGRTSSGNLFLTTSGTIGGPRE